MTKILMIDDDRLTSSLTQEYLEGKGLTVRLVHSGEEGIKVFRTESPFDLCLLDVKMPFKDGFAVAQEMRSFEADIPLIFLTGQTEKESRIKGFTLGGDDYVTKPFSMEELYWRIIAILRRVGKQEERTKRAEATTHFAVGQYQFDPNTRELVLGDKLQKLSAIEAALLRLFCESTNGIIERDFALHRIWQDDDLLRGRSLNTYVSKLRHYLADDAAIEILNVHGVGYRLVVRT
jgi:two-component system, OmpR family, response regulator